MTLKILILISLSLQLTGTFFLATQIVPKKWSEQLVRVLQEKQERLLKIASRTTRRQVEDWEWRRIASRGVFLIEHIPFIAYGSAFGGYLDDCSGCLRVMKESPWGMTKISANLMQILERGITKMGSTLLLQVFYFLSLNILIFTMIADLWLVVSYGKAILGIAYSLFRRFVLLFSYFSERQGKHIFALLGFFLLTVGFILQATVNWTGMK